MFTQSLNYALKALSYMSYHENGEYFRVKDISEKLEISPTYLTKILQDLARQKYLLSSTGPRGGFKVTEETKKISLLKLVEIIDGDCFKKSCFLGLPQCRAENPCPVHKNWEKHRDKMLEYMSKITVDQVLKTSWPVYREPI